MLRVNRFQLRSIEIRIRFASIACSVVLTISSLRRACEDFLDCIVGGTIVDRVYRGDELLDRVSVVHATPLGHS